MTPLARLRRFPVWVASVAILMTATAHAGVSTASATPAGGDVTSWEGLPKAAAAPHAVTVQARVPATAPRPSHPTAVRVDRKSSTSLRVWWSKVAGAKSYKVYRLVKGKWKVVKVTSKLSWVNKKLPKRKVQRYRVVACTGKKGTGRCRGKSPEVSAITYSKGYWRVNARAIVRKPLPVALGLVDVWNLEAEAVPSKKGQLDDKLVVSKKLRFVSSNPKVVAVEHPEDGGDLVGVGVGKAKITVTAHNGLTISFWVTGKDFTRPVILEWGGSPEVKAVLALHKTKIGDLAHFAVPHDLDVDGYLVLEIDKSGNLSFQGPGRKWPARELRWAYEILASSSRPARIISGAGRFEIEFLLNGEWDSNEIGTSTTWLAYGPILCVGVNRCYTYPPYHWVAGGNTIEIMI